MAANHAAAAAATTLTKKTVQVAAAATASIMSTTTSTTGVSIRPGLGVGLIDIGANLLDDMFQGRYHGKERHQPDLESVLEKAKREGVEAIICTAGSLTESQEALKVRAVLFAIGVNSPRPHSLVDVGSRLRSLTHEFEPFLNTSSMS